jgi:phosphoheptose isomerase
LSLLFSEKYSSAGVQLAFASTGAALEVMNAALKADAIYLLEALVAQRETLRSQLPQYQVDVFDRIVTNVTDRRRGHLYLESANIFGRGRGHLFPDETAGDEAKLIAAVEKAVEEWKRRQGIREQR